MKVSSIIKNTKGDKIKVFASLLVHSDSIEYVIEAQFQMKGNKSWTYIGCNSRDFEKLSMKEKRAYIEKIITDKVGEDFILSVKQKLHNEIAPKKEN